LVLPQPQLQKQKTHLPVALAVGGNCFEAGQLIQSVSFPSPGSMQRRQGQQPRVAILI
jgi:hypothetical protein